MAEPTITCPRCGTKIKLTESLAAPLIEATRKEYEELLAQKEEGTAEREKALLEREKALSKEKSKLDKVVAERLNEERPRIAAEEKEKARALLETDLSNRDTEIESLREIIKDRGIKLAEAQKAQAELEKQQLELEEKERSVDLTVAKKVREQLSDMRDKAVKDALEEHALKLADKDKVIDSLQKTIAELNRKAEQGSQQLQGEVQEITLEGLLSDTFQTDSIEPVKKGARGADILQRVIGPTGENAGMILWESKRTKNWSDTWLPKLREDQRTARADIGVLVSQALPKDVEAFALVDGIFVVRPRFVMPVASLLRQSVIEIASVRHAGEGQQTKTQLLYQYLTGTHFRQRVEAIVEAFSTMQEDLAREKKAITRQWAKREKQLENVAIATAGMYGDLQGIAGKTLKEIGGLDLPALSDGKEE